VALVPRKIRYIRKRLPRGREIVYRLLDKVLAPFTRDELLRHGPAGRRALALTFDDGPTAETTPRILDLLAQHDARATFFVLGKRIAGCEEILARLARDGHELANHTYRHEHTVYLSASQLREEVMDTTREIAATQPDVRFVRPPYGKDRRRFAKLARELGLTVAMWSIDSGDTSGYSTEEIVEAVMKAAAPGSIVLMHDGGGDRDHTVAACAEILPALRDAGFDLVTLSELVAVS
jgi:peptidoglycan/xylan/chitin deacetylase (PgdA/CDA1 family)